METLWNSVFDILDIKFKSYYVVWKLRIQNTDGLEQISLNRTM